jgi:hypothetical protein
MKITRAQFEMIRAKYGHYASWAIWAAEGVKPKENIGDLAVLDVERNMLLLEQLNSSIVLVGLNISRRIEVPLGNFHDSRPQAMDYKLRFAFKDTPFWGAYMTDIIKDFQQKVSGKVTSYLRSDRRFETSNVAILREELKDIGADEPTLVAFGRDAHVILKRNFGDEFTIFKLPHYSNYTGKEQYRKEVKAILGFQ